MNGETVALAAIGGLGAIIGWIVCRSSPKVTFVGWVLTMFFVPVWIGVSAGFFWAAITLATMLAIAASLHRVTLRPADAVVAVFAVFVLALFALRLVSLSAAVVAMLEWTVPYIWGRLVFARLATDWVTKAIAAIATAAAVFAVIEFVSGTNIFLALPALGPSFETWGQLQERGGFVRAEGAFGHSIALGAALAMSASFILAARWSLSARLLCLAVVAAAAVMTFSRLGLATLVLTVAVSACTLPQLSRKARVVIVGTGVVAALVVVPFLLDVFLDAGEEASGSAQYRGGLFALASQVQPFGSAGNWQGLIVDGTYLGQYADSVDNAVLVAALGYGVVPTALIVIGAVALAFSAFMPSRANPASVAVAAQIPSLFAVALITQYGMFLWFVAGLAIAWRDAAAREQTTAESGLAVPQLSELTPYNRSRLRMM